MGGYAENYAAESEVEVISTNSLVVNTLVDDPSGRTPGYTTLRDAINQADFDTANPYVITFSVTGTIDLTSPLPDLNNNIDIVGPGASDLTVLRDPNAISLFSVFTVDSGETDSLSGMTIEGAKTALGMPGAGGGILNHGDLTVNGAVFHDNYGGEDGGGLDNYGTATVNNSIFSDNSSEINGGGLDNFGILTVSDSLFSDNYSSDGGGIETNGVATVDGSTFTENLAGGGGGGIEITGTTTVKESAFIRQLRRRGGGIFTGTSRQRR